MYREVGLHIETLVCSEVVPVCSGCSLAWTLPPRLEVYARPVPLRDVLALSVGGIRSLAEAGVRFSSV